MRFEMDVVSKMRKELLQWSNELHGIKSNLVFKRLIRAAIKAGFDPDQPRDDRGQWTSTGSSEVNLAARDNAAECDFQYKQDKLICNLVQTPLCWAQAAERYGACLAGRPIPQLRF
jgi:hypothetical protein